MLQGIIDDAKSALGEVLARYTTRALIGFVFLVALGFAVAAIAIQLVDAFGAVMALWMIAGGFAVAGLIGFAAEAARERESAPVQEAASSASAAVGGAVKDAAAELPAIALSLFHMASSTTGSLSMLGVLRLLGRNAALLVLLAFMGLLLWPRGQAAEDTGKPDEAALG
ncbi:MAG: hypothetical protein NW223_03770 [Hyphomicrobiaceae bacterium]|nr:hypothetical protein [Hyphomicrobiaceae bacterium]